MKSEARMSKSSQFGGCQFRPSGFVIISDFVIRICEAWFTKVARLGRPRAGSGQAGVATAAFRNSGSKATRLCREQSPIRQI
jgi:hypothetical protein